MTAQLSRLRIAGFKSFAEPVSLDILPGLTGIVGPNGCGKSNVVEALRWAMGETSARSLRGGEMDDVIFAGTTARASRNLAEVTITLNGELPEPYAAEAELQVTRRIERGAGSQFRANGRELRARDVQTLYADLASGARSSGMVSQGRVAALVNAKPEERRQVLEEAAGITGLHARRHEAELKLRGAEQNLARADDLRIQLEGAQEGMRKQARQAARYRNISALVRAVEGEHLAVLLEAARRQVDAAAAAYATAHLVVEAAQAEAAIAGKTLDNAEAALPALRDALGDAARVLERGRIAAESLAADAERATRNAAEAEQRLLDTTADLDAAERACADTGASVDRLHADAARLDRLLAELPDRLAAAGTGHAIAETRANAAQVACDEAARAAMAASLTAAQAKSVHAIAQDRLIALRALHAHAVASHDAAVTALVGQEALAAADDAVSKAHVDLTQARQHFDDAESSRGVAAAAHAESRMRAGQVQAAHAAAAHGVREAASRRERLAQSLNAARQALAALTGKRIDPAILTSARDAADAARVHLEACERLYEASEQEAAAARQQAAEAARAQADMRAEVARAAATLADARARADRIGKDCTASQEALAEAVASAPDADAVGRTSAARATAECALAGCAATVSAAQAAAFAADAKAAQARQTCDQARSAAAQLEGAAAGLADAMQDQASDGSPPVLADIAVPAGLEAAVGVALGAGADASRDQAADRFWRSLPWDGVGPVLPEGATALAGLIDAPDALGRALAHVALLPDGTDGDALQAMLPPGMVAVTRQGACWRWDGHVTRAGAPNPAALRLGQRRRLAEALAASQAAAARADAASGALHDAMAQADAAAAAAGIARDAHQQAAVALNQAIEAHQHASGKAALADARMAALKPGLEQLIQEQAAADAVVAEACRAAALLPQHGELETAARGAAARAGTAMAALDRAGADRQAARVALDTSRNVAAVQGMQDAETEARIAASTPALEDLTADAAAAADRLAEAEAEAARLPDLGAALTALHDREVQDTASRAAEAEARSIRARAEAALATARTEQAAIKARHSQMLGQRAVQAGLLARAAEDLTQAEHDLNQAESSIADLPDLPGLHAVAQSTRDALDSARVTAQAARAGLEALQNEAAQARVASELVQADRLAWQARHRDADARARALTVRAGLAREAWRALSASPAETSQRAERSAAALAEAEATHAAAAHCLSAAEQHVRGLAVAQRDGEQRAGACRETVLRTQAALDAATSGMQTVSARAAERLGADAELPTISDASADALERARRKLDRLSREREEMGPVNLRAELELAELDERLATLERERDELGTAIAKLRGAIGHLNREGRARLSAVFTEVDRHFRTLFTRMMGGGRAHLALTGSDDPLLAGLEIYAEPPGKKLVSLSLLSGGEQALTALSLIFAVFRCTPAPISVLDEVDAPLDDANVERFCNLLDDVVRDTGTRFLVVTHHQLTMSRMDRLFGVTMQERGVSRLLSVDLGRAMAIVEPVLRAAE